MTTLKHLALREKVIETCLAMNEEGINQGTSGNVSVRTPEGFLITASGIPYRRMRPEQVVEMDLDGGYRGEFLPSTEWRMHLDIYAVRPEAGAIVHVHSPYATALACLRREVPAFHYMIAAAGGRDLRCAPYATFGTAALSQAVLGALEGRRACLMAHHGMIALGSTLDAALALAVEVEWLAATYARVLTLGEPQRLDDAEMDRVIAKFATYGNVGLG